MPIDETVRVSPEGKPGQGRGGGALAARAAGRGRVRLRHSLSPALGRGPDETTLHRPSQGGAPKGTHAPRGAVRLLRGATQEELLTVNLVHFYGSRGLIHSV